MKKLLTALLCAYTASLCTPAFAAFNFDAVSCDPCDQAGLDDSYSFFEPFSSCSAGQILVFGKVSGNDDNSVVGGAVYPSSNSAVRFSSLNFDYGVNGSSCEPWIYLEFLSFPQRRTMQFLTLASFWAEPATDSCRPYNVSITSNEVNSNSEFWLTNGFIAPGSGATLNKVAVWSDDATDFFAVGNMKVNGTNTIINLSDNSGVGQTDCDLGQNLLCY